MGFLHEYNYSTCIASTYPVLNTFLTKIVFQNGFVFEKVSELLAAKSMPCAVRTGAAWRGSGASSTIESGEVLLIKGIKKRLNTKTLKVYNLATGKKKELPESCVGVYACGLHCIHVLVIALARVS